jgi:hypothetical protein
VNDGNDTIEVGEDTGLMPGDAVTYSNGGGTDIGGLTDGTTYFVTDVTDGKIKLSDSRGGPAINLMGPVMGDAHKLTRVNPVEIPFDPSPGVDVDADTLRIGENTGLRTGTAVTYDNGGGDSIAIDGGTLTDDDGTTKYFVIEAGDDKTKLATTLANAEAGLAIDLTGLGTGSEHKFTRVIPEVVTFDPDAKRVELELARDTAWTTGEPVVYDNGGGTDITGLEDGTTYFVISDGTDIIKLATTQEKARLGEAILLTPGGGIGAPATRSANHVTGTGRRPPPAPGPRKASASPARSASRTAEPTHAPAWRPAARSTWPTAMTLGTPPANSGSAPMRMLATPPAPSQRCPAASSGWAPPWRSSPPPTARWPRSRTKPYSTAPMT